MSRYIYDTRSEALPLYVHGRDGQYIFQYLLLIAVSHHRSFYCDDENQHAIDCVNSLTSKGFVPELFPMFSERVECDRSFVFDAKLRASIDNFVRTKVDSARSVLAHLVAVCLTQRLGTLERNAQEQCKSKSPK